MNENNKRILMTSVIGLSVTLLLLGFIIGMVDKSKKKGAEKEKIEEATSSKNGEVWQYIIPDKDRKRSDLSEDKVDTSSVNTEIETNDVDGKNYLVVPEDVPKNPSLSDIFTTKDLEETNALAKDFVTQFHSFDKDRPTDHIDAVEGKLVQSHVDYLRNNKSAKVEGLIDVTGIVSRRVLSVEIKEPTAPTLIAISWDGVVISEVVDSKGQVRKDKDVYSMMFEKGSDGKFLITDYYLNYDQKR